MKTPIRKPKLNRKPDRGMKMFMKQTLKGLKNALLKAAGPKRPDQYWHTPEAMRAKWLLSIRGSFKPHQGTQERSRRMHQMASHKCINPECWINT